MNRAVVLATFVMVWVDLGCGGASDGSNSVPAPALAGSCMPGGAAPPAKLIIPPTGGVSGRWIVALADDTTPLHATAVMLAWRYGGKVLDEWDTLGMFLMGLDDSAAAALSEDPAVCYVEQDAIVHAT